MNNDTAVTTTIKVFFMNIVLEEIIPIVLREKQRNKIINI